MTTAFNIPLKPGIPQSFLTTLNGIDYRLTLQWREAMGSWILDLLDVFGNPLACGLPLVTGANILQQFPDLNIGGEMWVITDGAPSDTPTFNSLGATSHLWYVVDGTVLTNFAPSGARASPVITIQPPGLIPPPILPPLSLDPTMVGVGSVSGHAHKHAITTATLVGHGGVIANLVRRTLASATLHGLGVVAARSIFQQPASATIAGNSSVIARPQANLLTKATLAGTGAVNTSALNPTTAAGVRLPAGWTLQRLDTFGTTGSVPGPVRMHALYDEAINFGLDSANGRVFLPTNAVINNQQQTYQFFEDSTFNFMSDRLRIQGRGQSNSVIKSGQFASKTAYRSFIFEARFTAPATLGTWVEMWAYGSTTGNDTSELDFELLMSMNGTSYGAHNANLNNHPYNAPSGDPVGDDPHFSFSNVTGLLNYDNPLFDKTTGPHYYTIYYDDTGGGTVRRYIDGVLIYHFPNWKWNNSLGGTGNGPDAQFILDLAAGTTNPGLSNFPGQITSPASWTGDMDVYSVGFYAPGAAGRAIPAGQAWDNALKSASITLSGGDLIATAGTTAPNFVYALDPMYNGKYYWEVVISGGTNIGVGLGGYPNQFGMTTYLGDANHGVGWYGSGGAATDVLYSGGIVANWASFGSSAQRLCFALHVVPGGVCKLWGRVGTTGLWNNGVIGNQNPATDTGGYTVPFTNHLVPAVNLNTTGDTATLVAASGSWAGTPPTGFGQIGPR